MYFKVELGALYPPYMKTINFAILGCGRIGTRHAAKLHSTDDVNLVAVCDIIPERAENLANEYGCRSYTALEDMLKDSEIDFVNICTPSGMHAPHSVECLDSGKNVLCEKPMALSLEDAKAMVECAQKNDQLLYVVKQNRHNPPVKLVKQLIQEGKLGKPIMVSVDMFWNRNNSYYENDEWRGTLTLDGGTIFTQASHFVDLMLMFLGKPKSVYSLMGTMNHDIEIEDTGAVTAQFENGAFGVLNYTTCATNKNFEGSITLIFEKGTIKIGGEYINTIDYFQVEGAESYELEETTATANDYGTYRGSMSNHHEIFKDILNHMNGNGSADLVHSDDAIATIAFIEAAMKSAKEGGPVTL